MTPINSTDPAVYVKSPAGQLIQAFYEAVGKPPHMKPKGPVWKQLAALILEEDKYQFEHVLGAIRWFPSNDWWRRRLTDFQDFKENIDKVLSEYHASLPRKGAVFVSAIADFEALAQRALENGFRKSCVMCAGTGEYKKKDNQPRKCLACQDELVRIYRRLKGIAHDPYGHNFEKQWNEAWAKEDRSGCECKGTGYVTSTLHAIKTLDGREEFIPVTCRSCCRAKEKLRVRIVEENHAALR